MQTLVSREAIVRAYEQGLEAVLALFDQALEPIGEQLVALVARVEELERQRSTDSHNSSKPPSSDPPGSHPSPSPGTRTKSLRQPSGKKSGGQPGHPGATLKMVEHPDRITVHSPEACAACGASLREAKVVDVERRQVIDLPKVLLEVTEHQAESRLCVCGEVSSGTFPENVAAPVQYGPRLVSVAVYLSQYQLVPMERVSEALADVFGCEGFSEGTLHSALDECHLGLAEVEAKIKEGLRQAEVVHFDETGLEVGGKLNWLHVACTSLLTHYGWATARGPAGADRHGILPQFKGTGIHDGLETYFGYAFVHGLCNIHHLRELVEVEEHDKQPWASAMQALLREMKASVDDAKARGEAKLKDEVLAALEARYQSLLAEGFAMNPPPERPPGTRGRPKRGRVLALLDRLSNHREAVLRFLHDFRVPFDNNQAERDIRMVKVKQKISGCFRSDNGADRFCRIRGYISTMRKQHQSILACLASVFLSNPIMPALAT
jgi:transposase